MNQEDDLQHRSSASTWISAGTLIALVMFGALIWLGKDAPKKTAVNSDTAELESSNPNLPTVKVLAALQENFEIDSPVRPAPLGRSWLTSDNLRIVLAGDGFAVGQEYRGLALMPNADQLAEFAADIDQYFVDNGYTKSIPNSSQPNQNDIGLTKGGFSKDEMYCIYNLLEDSDPYGDFFCGTVDEEQTELKLEMYAALNPAHDPTQDFIVRKTFNNFATGYAGFVDGFGGYGWIAEKTAQGWRVLITDLQEWPYCEDVDRHQIPREIYENCFVDEAGEPRFGLN